MNETDPQTRHPGLTELFRYPLMSAIAERRSRRVCRGTSIEGGDVSHQSSNAAAPLSPLEEAVLVVTTGLTGVLMHDGPVGNGEFGTGSYFMQVRARAAASPDNTQPTSFFLVNDTGVFLIKKLARDEALQLLAEVPPRWADWSESDWLAAAQAVTQRVFNERLQFPRQFPYYHMWNKALSNRPGTTLLLPIVDMTRSFISVVLNILSEPEAERALFLDDWQPFTPKTAADVGAWLAAGLGLLPDRIPYQPVGGVEWAQSGTLNPKIRIPLGLAHTFQVDYEAILLLQNLVLTGQALGLGGWLHASTPAPLIYERDPAKGIFGLGFRMHTPDKNWGRWPPTPSTLPNPVGLDGVIQALCPPYVSMNDAVDRVLDEKFGNQGTYRDVARFARAYRNVDGAEAYLRQAQQYSAKTVEYMKVLCNYIYDTYGRFPAHVDAFHLPGVWMQFSHLELEYYEKYFDPALYRQQASHDPVWHRTP
ncbi:MAG TPA: hypothetical protein VKD69_24200 [Vicinamibacterales bacterium]|nr:hypothetical protein [Vicinamibacterales bacterium]